MKIKNNEILPKPEYNTPEIVDFLFYIQDLYFYNQQAYSDMVHSLDDFNRIYELSIINIQRAGVNISLLRELKRNIINSLHSIILKTPVNKTLYEKINNSIVKLNTLLQHHIDEIIKINNDYNNKIGYSINTVFESNEDVVPINTYDLMEQTFYKKPLFTYDHV